MLNIRHWGKDISCPGETDKSIFNIDNFVMSLVMEFHNLYSG